MSELTAKSVSQSFGEKTVLEEVSFSVASGAFCALLGPSGSGKTTLLNLIAGLDIPRSGQIVLNGRDITQEPAHRRRIGMVFQNYALFPHMTVRDNVEYGLRVRGEGADRRRKKSAELLELVGLAEKSTSRPSELSGGQQQRVALARALAVDPEVLLLDEPLSALDKKIRQEMQRELKRIHRETNITTVMVTHDQEEALDLADQVVLLDSGVVQQDMPPSEVYTRPTNRFVAEFLGLNSLEGMWVDKGTRKGVQLSNHFFPLPETVLVTRVRDGEPVRLIIRPEAVLLNERESDFTVVGERFLGPTTSLSIEIGPGQLLEMIQLSEAGVYRSGQRVGIELKSDGVRVFAARTTPIE